MSYKQLIPGTPVSESFGLCLAQIRKCFGVAALHPTATVAANATKHRHTSRTMPNVNVPVWFNHWGTYGSPARYDNFGHVVMWDAAKKKFWSTPLWPSSPYGGVWFDSLAAVERHIGGTYRFWSEDINGVRVVEPGSGGTPANSGKGTIVKKHYRRRDKTANASKHRNLPVGSGFYLNQVNTNVSNATNIVGGIGYYSITCHVYLTGTPGDKVDLVLIWQDTTKKPRENSRHFVETIEIGADGTAKRNVEFKRHVSRGFAVYARLEAPKTNKSAVKVNLLDTDSYLFG